MKTEQTWFDGFPTKFRAEEWFIAMTVWGDRVVLRALPDEYAYDFKTADDTYIKRDKIVKWMPFPDSKYISPAAKLLSAERAISDKLLETLKEAAETSPYGDEYQVIIAEVEELRRSERSEVAMRKERRNDL